MKFTSLIELRFEKTERLVVRHKRVGMSDLGGPVEPGGIVEERDEPPSPEIESPESPAPGDAMKVHEEDIL